VFKNIGGRKMNSVNLVGRLTKDPSFKEETENSSAVATFSLAIDRLVGQGKEKQTDFPRITVFGKRAENCEKFLKKGRLVAVQGSLQTGSYKNKDGVTVYTTDVIANNVEFLEWGDKNNKSDNDSQNEDVIEDNQEESAI
jgi:single-strand DNA-binding protein